MPALLEVVLTFVGVMFVLALAAQSIQEILKTALVIKGRTMFAAISGLVRESVRAQGQWSIDAEAIMAELTRRLEALGQHGFRKGKVRLDALPSKLLRNLVSGIDPALIPGLPVEKDIAQEVLTKIADQTETWYPLAVAPVDDRYRRRMRVLAVLASALVVIPLNAGADRIYRAARNDAKFRESVSTLVAHLDSVETAAKEAAPGALSDLSTKDSMALNALEQSVADTAKDSLAGATSDTAAADTNPAAVTKSRSAPPGDSQSRAALAALASGELNFGPPSGLNLKSAGWWLGILVSVIFVSLGAPFWHDLLETIFGLKNRLQLKNVENKEQLVREGEPV